MKKLLSLLVIITILGCKQEPKIKIKTLQGKIFGTYYGIKYERANHKTADIKKGIDSIFKSVNNSLNTYIPDSDISKINKGDSTIVTDLLFRKMFTLSSKINKTSKGYFDPTVGTLRNAYGFGDTNALNNISKKQLDSIMQFVGWQKVTLNKNGTIAKQHPQIYFDFNAIAKGYGIDLIVDYLSSKNIKNLSVEIGGEIRVKGKNIDKNKFWTIGIESVNSDIENRSTRDIIQLKNKAIAGSGNYRKNRTDPISGKKLVHTINPLTGKAEQGNILSTYVIANTCAEADAYATAIMAMNTEKAKEMINNTKDIEVYLVYKTNDNINTYITSGFEKLILK